MRNTIKPDIAGIIMLDPACIVHRARSFTNRSHRIAHDRPQLVVDFRASMAREDWSPPLVVMSRKRAAAVSSQDITRIYGLEAMQFIDGESFNCGALGKPSRKLQREPGQVKDTLVTSS